MKEQINEAYLLKTMEAFINTPSPVSYYEEANALLCQYAKELGYEVEFDRKRTGYIKVAGADHSKTVCVGAHLDTLGLIIKRIDKDGMIRVRNLGGINFNNIEGETVHVHTRDGKDYTGLVACQYHSVHVFDEARVTPRDENNMMIILDEDVHSEEDVRALGIQHGDLISIEPRFTVTENGFIKSRFIDDKAAVAAVLSVIKYMKENNMVPAYDTWFAFPHYEEIGHGGAYVPEEVSEYVAVDFAVIGPDHSGSEQKVSICVKDNFSPYDRELTDRIVKLAAKHEVDFVEDIFYHYGTDANSAVRAGNNIQAAAFGMGTFASHGMERTTVHAVMETAKLVLAYVLND